MNDSLADGDYLKVKRGQIYDLSDATGRSNAFRQTLALMRYLTRIPFDRE
jgi:hypothetical protein